MVLSAFAVAIMDTAVSSCGAETTVTTPSSVTARMSFCEDVQVTVLSSAPVTVAVSVTESPALISVTAEPITTFTSVVVFVLQATTPSIAVSAISSTSAFFIKLFMDNSLYVKNLCLVYKERLICMFIIFAPSRSFRICEI